MNRRDILIIATFLLFAGVWGAVKLVAGFGDARDAEAVAEISVAGKIVDILPMSGEERDVSIVGALGPLTVRVGSGTAYVAASSCPSQDCVRAGKITSRGQCVACLPNRALIRVKGGATANANSEVDAIAE
ncbi:MAG: NusG domain II-containing protein [Clostridiales Family XIII bacterium]|jgi:hypothetical protein|nr:NusG domain II-containing protein [Clostridiales Family XIII bacterium]